MSHFILLGDFLLLAIRGAFVRVVSASVLVIFIHFFFNWLFKIFQMDELFSITFLGFNPDCVNDPLFIIFS